MVKKVFILCLLAVSVLLFSLAGPVHADKEKTGGNEATSASQTQPATSTVYYGFEELMGGWRPHAKTVKTNLSYFVHDERVKANLTITGVAGIGLWNYAASPRFYIEPGKTYRLGAWMFVESLNDPAYPPFLKCALYQDANWITNFLTNKYDMNRKNEWQRMSVVFQTPKVENIRGGIALEKGAKDIALEATIILHDVTLELLQ